MRGNATTWNPPRRNPSARRPTPPPPATRATPRETTGRHGPRDQGPRRGEGARRASKRLLPHPEALRPSRARHSGECRTRTSWIITTTSTQSLFTNCSNPMMKIARPTLTHVSVVVAAAAVVVLPFRVGGTGRKAFAIQ